MKLEIYLYQKNMLELAWWCIPVMSTLRAETGDPSVTQGDLTPGKAAEIAHGPKFNPQQGVGRAENQRIRDGDNVQPKDLPGHGFHWVED